MEAYNMKRRPVVKGVPFLLLGIAVIIAVAIYIFLNPEILKDLLWLAFIIIAAIVAVVLVVFAVMMILAIPFYVFKGEQYQDGTSYDLKDVNDVRGTSDREEKKE
jgi:uncharacterized membrane protein YccC